MVEQKKSKEHYWQVYWIWQNNLKKNRNWINTEPKENQVLSKKPRLIKQLCTVNFFKKVEEQIS